MTLTMVFLMAAAFAALALGLKFAETFNTPKTDGKGQGPLDANLQFSAAQVVAMTGDSTVTLDVGDKSSASPYLEAKLIALITALKTSAGDETYEVEVFESDSADSGFVTVGTYATVTATGQITKVLGITKRYVKLTFTLAGTDPSMTLSAFLSYD